jgi:sugar-specific transcriptional regulator TrmB
LEESTHTLLRDMGLSPYEIDALVALLSTGSSSAVDLVPLCKVPRSRIYEVLSNLVSKGFASVRPGKPPIYEAVPPRDAFGYRLYVLKSETDRRIKSIESRAENAIPLLEKLSNLKPDKSLDPEDVAWVYYNEDRFRSSVTDLVRNCKTSFLYFTSQPKGARREEAYRSRIGAIYAALQRGIDVRLIHLLDSTMDLELYRDLTRKGAKHMVPKTELRESFSVIDAVTSSLLIRDESGRFRYGLIVQDKFISSLLTRYFDEHWEKSIPAEKVIQQLQKERNRGPNTDH